MDVNVLIVEDQYLQSEGIRACLKNIPEPERGTRGIGQIHTEIAMAEDEAEQWLNKRQEEPFDIMLLDLSLPKARGNATEDIQAGMRLLDLATRTGAACSTIVISRFDEYPFISRSFLGGARDFIAKDYDPDDLPRRFLNCWTNLLRERSQHLLERRIRTLFPLAQSSLAYRFGIPFSEFLEHVVRSTEKMDREIQDRFGVDASRTDEPITQLILGFKEALHAVRGSWQTLQAPLFSANQEPTSVNIEALLTTNIKTLEPCLVVKGVDVAVSASNAPRVLSFGDDVTTVLHEILVGAMLGLQDGSEKRTRIAIEVSCDERYAQISVTDNLPPIAEEDANTICESRGMLPDPNFSRVWGLSVAQHVAFRGGGRIEVFPEAECGNTIIYHIPVRDHE